MWFNNETCRPAEGITYSAGTARGWARRPRHGHSRVFTREQTIYIQAVEGKRSRLNCMNIYTRLYHTYLL